MLTDEYRYKLFRVLGSNPKINQRELARTLGISLGKVNYCLNALIENRWLKSRNFTHSNSKRAYMYCLTPRGFQEKTRVTVRFFRRKVVEYEALSIEIETPFRETAREEQGAGSTVRPADRAVSRGGKRL